MHDKYLTPVLRLLQASDVISARVAGEFSAVHGLSVKEVFLLMHLEGAALHRLSRVELARRMHLSASTVTRMALPMEKLGLVKRQPDERDARLAYVVLTKAGLKRLNETRATFAKQAADVFRDRWTEQDINQLSALLGRLVLDSPGNLT